MKGGTTPKQKKTLDDIDNDNVSISVMTNIKPVEWSIENEMILVDWCDTAQCYKWLHSRSHTKYSHLHAWFTIPTIGLSTISGTASFAQAGAYAPNNAYISMAIGTINLCVGILTTVQQYLKISELKESHRVSAIAWDKFARNIRIELAKAPGERMDAAHFLKINRQEYDRLMESSPSIQSKIIAEFKCAFVGEEGSVQRKTYENLRKPDICDTIVSSNTNRHHWYLEQKPFASGVSNKLDALNLDIKNKEDEVADETEKYNKLQGVIKNLANQHMEELKMKKIKSYTSKFEEVLGRQPIKDEMIEHFKGDKDIDGSFLHNYFSKIVKTDTIPPPVALAVSQDELAGISMGV